MPLSPSTRLTMTVGPRGRVVVIAAASLLFALSTASALLPRLGAVDWASVVGGMLALAGVTEMVGGTGRPSNRLGSIAPGFVTAMAGAVLLLGRYPALFPLVWWIIAWLVVRALVQLWSSVPVSGSVRFWTLLGAGKDLLFAAILLVGLTSFTLPALLFGPTPAVSFGLAGVLAFNFIATALLLLEVAACDFDDVATG